MQLSSKRYFIIKNIPIIIFFVTLTLILIGLYIQHVMNIEPCPLCIIQRYFYFFILVTSFFSLFFFSKILIIFTIVFAFFGSATAVRHIYLERNPPETFDCVADVGFLMENFPLTKTLPMIFQGKADCTEIPLIILGLSIAEWSLAWFIIIMCCGIFYFKKNYLRSSCNSPA
jgi:disulfide bond formation protein DsbB